MFYVAICIGVFSYVIFLLGVFHLLYKPVILVCFAVCIIVLLLFLRRAICSFRFGRKFTSFSIIILSITIIQAVVNLVGVLGPEIGFDALWYHLTLPKLYLDNHAIYHIPGSLLYYSDMPKLTEMLYIVALSLGNEITAKFIHFSFGILILIALYKLSRKFFDRTSSFLVILVFYSNLVVGWESVSAYIDLSRTFFEVLSLWALVNFAENREKKWLVIAALMFGFALSTKILALASIVPLLFLLFAVCYKQGIKTAVKSIMIFCVISMSVVLPWMIFSFINTGNPVYPFFSKIYPVYFAITTVNIFVFIRDLIQLLLFSADPISPIYIIMAPILILYLLRVRVVIRYIALYVLMAILIWYITPRTGGGRFILPYLPAASLLVIAVIKTLKSLIFQRIIIAVILLLAGISVSYRAIANAKYFPFLVGKETKSKFLSKHLDFTFGNFYDIDGYFSKKITRGDNVLIYGVHNLYYVEFPFAHESYIKAGESFNYILTQNTVLPVRFKSWGKVYVNPHTRVELYSHNGKWMKY